MKRLFLFFSAFIIIHITFAATTFTVNGINYRTISDTTVTVARGSYTGNIIIPANVSYSGTVYSVVSINNESFSYCTQITSITIPSSVIWISSDGFNGCSSLTAINVENANAVFSSDNGVVFNKDKTKLKIYPPGKTDKSYSIPSSVTSIGSSAFHGCSTLTSISLPLSLISIGESAFYGCEGLSSIDLPSTLRSISAAAFERCTNVTTITIPSSVSYIDDEVFVNCTKLKAINVENADTAYSSDNGVLFNKHKTKLICFPDGKTDKSYSIPSSVTAIGYDAFADCRTLTSVIFPSSLITIGEQSFQGCSGLASIKFTLPSSLTSIGPFAFDGCSFATITLPSSLTSIRERAFRNQFLTKIIIPSSVTYIGEAAFEYCDNLTTITIPSSVTYIGGEVFNDCSKLSSIYVFNSTPLQMYDCPFCGFISTSSIILHVPHGSKNLYAVADNWKNFNNIVDDLPADFYDSDTFYKITSSTSTAHTVAVSPATFSYNSYTDSIAVPSSVTKDNIAYTVTAIRDSTFYNSTGLTSVTLPLSVDSIGNNAFENCSGLTSLYENNPTPANIILGSDVFKGVVTATSMKSMQKSESVALVSPCVLHVPSGSKSLYQAAEQWKDFYNIVEDISSGINNNSLTSISIFPNPATNYFTVSGLETENLLTIVDLSGKMVMQQQISPDEHISIAGLSKGIYIVKVNNKTIKLIVK